MTDFVSQSATIGSVPAIPNSLASVELDTAILTDPEKITAYKRSVADQMNAQSAGPKFVDLSERIAGLRIETSAQGASVLVVDLIDPHWVIPMSGFLAVDQYGYLWPPIDVNFPTGTDCVWRLCQLHCVWDAELTGPNLTLTLEDRIASILREISPASNGGLAQGQPNQTLGGFIKQLVDNANQNLKPHPGIRLVELISPQDPNYTPPITNLPSSAQAPLGQQPIRPNPLKLQKGLTAGQQASVSNAQNALEKALGVNPVVTPTALQISAVEQSAAALLGQQSVLTTTFPNLTPRSQGG